MSSESLAHHPDAETAPPLAPPYLRVIESTPEENPSPQIHPQPTGIRKYPWEEESAVGHAAEKSNGYGEMHTNPELEMLEPEAILAKEITVAGLRLELLHRRRLQYLLNQAPASTMATSPKDDAPQLSDSQRQSLLERLPILSPLQRQVLVLSTCYNTPPKTMSLLLSRHPSVIEKALQAATPPSVLTEGVTTAAARFHKSASHGRFRQTVQEKIISIDEKVLLHHPLITFTVENYGTEDNGHPFNGRVRLSTIRFRSGKMTINAPGDTPMTKQQKVAIMASLGLTNQQIGGHLDIKTDTVKTHISHSLRTNQVSKRIELPARFVSEQFFIVTQPAEPLELTDEELTVVEGVVNGDINRKIGEDMEKTEDIIKSYIRKILTRNQLSSREQIAVAALMSGQVELLQQ